MHGPTTIHMDVVYWILWYLNGCSSHGLLFKNQHGLQVDAYTNVDGVGSISYWKSIYGYCTFVGGNLVTWRSKKQSVVTRSNVEAEYRAIAHGVCELLLKMLLSELRFSVSHPMHLFYDNKAALSIAHDPVQRD